MLVFISCAAIGFLVWFMWRMYRSHPYSIYPILFPCIILVWEGVSVAFLESGVYSPELYITTRWTGATLRYVAALFTFLGAYWIVFHFMVSGKWRERVTKSAPEEAPELVNWAICALGLATGLVLLYYMPSGPVESKSKYIVENPQAIRDFVLKYMPFIGFALGFAAANTRNLACRFATYASAVCILGSLVLFGNKFSGLISFFAPMFLTYAAIATFAPAERKLFGLNQKQQAWAGAAALVGIMAFSMAKYLAVADLAGMDYLIERVFILQGGIWWYTDYQAFFGSYHPGFDAFVEFSRQHDYHKNSSLMYLMSRAIGYDLTYKIFFVDISLYTGAFPAVFYELFGKTGPVVAGAVAGAATGICNAYLVRKILRRQFILAMVAFSLYLPIMSVMDGGEFTQLFSYTLLVKLLVLLIIELVVRVLTYDVRFPRLQAATHA